jgi:hypothetical protein
MKILSKHHDYYDSVLRHGQDFSIIYKREKIEIPEKDWFFAFENWHANKNHNPKIKLRFTHYESWKRTELDYSCVIIGFCGRIFPGVRYKLIPRGKTWEKTIKGVTFDKDVIIGYLEEHGLKRDKRVKKGRRFNHKYLDAFDKIEEFFAQDLMMLTDIFYHYKVPAFAIECPTDYYGREGTLELNPILKEYDFQNVMPHMRAFQEIEAYLSGVIGAEGPILYQLSDKEKITKAGFDKWSFRTMPEKIKGK